MDSNNRDFLGTEPIGKLLFKLAVPTVIAQLINMLYNIVDRIYIGHMGEEGALALTGVGVCLPIIMMVAAFAALISSGGAPRASIEMGRKNQNEAEKIMSECFTTQIVISVVLTVILLLWHRQILLAFGASDNTIEYASAYMGIYAIGTIFVQLTLGLNAFITAQGYTNVAMKTVIIGALSNILLDPLFIFVFHLGVRGAALATILSQGLSAIWCVVFLSGGKSVLHLNKNYFKIEPKVVLPCIALGAATFIMQSSESIITVCFNSSLLRYGGDIAVGAMTICSSIMQFLQLPMVGIGQGAQPISSYNYGAGNVQRVKKTFSVLLRCSLLYAVSVWILIMLMPHVFASIFTSDAQLIDFSSKAVRIFCGAMCLFGIQMACQMTFVSIGYAVCSIIVAVVRKFVLLLPFIYLMPHILKDATMAVYTAEPVADVLAVTFTAILFTVQFRKAMRKLEGPNIQMQ